MAVAEAEVEANAAADVEDVEAEVPAGGSDLREGIAEEAKRGASASESMRVCE